MSAKYDQDMQDLKSEVFILQQVNTDLHKRVERLESSLATQQDAKTHSVLNDQYARRSHMVIYGLTENNDEDPVQVTADIIKDNLKIQTPARDIEVAHRLGAPTAGKKRPMAVVFRYRDKKYDLMRARKMLKGTGVVFSEDLCKEIRDLLQNIKQHNLVDSAWALNGKIFMKPKSGNVKTVRYGDKWKDFLNPA